VGIVTDRDLTLDVLEPRADPDELTAADVMTEHPTTVGEDDGVFEVTKAMFEAKVRRLPVVDDEGTLAGIVALDDFLVLFTDELNGLAGVVEAESPPY
jgi:CBS domain-containing protein